MKRLIILPLLLLTMVSFGQNNFKGLFVHNRQRFFGGVILGLNVSQVDGDTYGGFNKAGLNAGGTVYWFFTKSVNGSLEFLFSQKGSRSVTNTYSPQAGNYFADYRLRLNYVEVPLMFHYLFNRKYMIGVGGSFNALVSEKESMSDAYGFIDFDADKYPFERFTFDIMAAVSMNFWSHFVAQARYQYGITPLRKYNNVVPFVPGMGDRDQFDNMLTFRLMYLF